MELTNNSAIDIFGQYNATQPELARSRDRLGSGKRITRSSDDPGVTAIAMKKHAELSRNQAIRTGLQNAISYANMQHEGLNQVGEIYHRMGVLSQKSLDVMKNDHDRGLLQKEFDELVDRLIKIRNDKFNGVTLFDPLVSCSGGAPVDFSDGLNEQMPADYLKSNGDPEVVDPDGVTWNRMWEAAADVHTYEGKLTFEVNGGTAAERYVVRQGDTVIFDTQQWKTAGNAYNYDFDQFVIEFGVGQPTTYTFTPLDTGDASKGNSGTPDNPIPNGIFDNVTQNFGEGGSKQPGVIQTTDAPGDSTILKVQIYSNSLFQAEALFEPIVTNNDQVVLTDVNGETMTIDSLGFGTMAGFGVKTVADAQSTLEKLYGQTGDGTREGEVHCLLTEQQSKAAAHLSRLNSAIEKLRVSQVSEERVLNTIEGVDFAMETTRLARHNVKMETLNRLLATATRMTDVLIPLAAQRPGGA